MYIELFTDQSFSIDPHASKALTNRPREMSAQTLLSPVLEAHAGKRVALVFDSITELGLTVGFQGAYRFVKNTLEQLAESQTSAPFLFNPAAHSQSETSSLRGLFANQLNFGKVGLTTVRLHP